MTVDPQGLIRILVRLGMRLTADNKYLGHHGTRDKMTGELRHVISAHKQALIRLVKQ